jgi:glycosyltransferase involved in cell wall biosynthesis
MPLSVIIITRNESANIVACLESVAFADEVIVLDGQSTDDTVALAQKQGAKVFLADSWEGFGPQKNKALSFASHEWVLSIDADERVSADLSLEIKRVLSQPSFTLYDIPRLTNFCGQWIHHCGWRPDRVTRLFQKHTARFSDDVVHEKLLSLEDHPGADLNIHCSTTAIPLRNLIGANCRFTAKHGRLKNSPKVTPPPCRVPSAQVLSPSSRAIFFVWDFWMAPWVWLFVSCKGRRPMASISLCIV